MFENKKAQFTERLILRGSASCARRGGGGGGGGTILNIAKAR